MRVLLLIAGLVVLVPLSMVLAPPAAAIDECKQSIQVLRATGHVEANYADGTKTLIGDAMFSTCGLVSITTGADSMVFMVMGSSRARIRLNSNSTLNLRVAVKKAPRSAKRIRADANARKKQDTAVPMDQGP